MGLGKTLGKAKKDVIRTWTGPTKPTVAWGSTAWPGSNNGQENFSIRSDHYDRVIRNGVSHHRFQIQPKARKIPTIISKWMRENGGSTHAVMAGALIKDSVTENEVANAVEEAFEGIEI